MMFASRSGRIVLTASNTSGGSGTGVETWEYDGATWVQRTTPSGLKPAGHGLAYDSKRGRGVLFGGVAVGAGFLDTTWEYDDMAKTWTQVTPATSPSARSLPAMAYDPIRGKTVLFGGYVISLGGRGNDTWEWDGSTWTAIATPTLPHGRSKATMYFDALQGRIVMYGGDSSLSSLRDAWEYDGMDWHKLEPDPNGSLPLLASRVQMAYDSRQGQAVLLTTGFSSSPTETWALGRARRAVSESCELGTLDYDADGTAGCEDIECWSACTPSCAPGTSGATCTSNPRCGDGLCDPVECGMCPGDCAASTGLCPASCGDFVCALPETLATCPGDCTP
jgi:hypothetical protein